MTQTLSPKLYFNNLQNFNALACKFIFAIELLILKDNIINTVGAFCFLLQNELG